MWVEHYYNIHIRYMLDRVWNLFRKENDWFKGDMCVCSLFFKQIYDKEILLKKVRQKIVNWEDSGMQCI